MANLKEIDMIRSILKTKTTNQSYFCGYQAPVLWLHPNENDNLSERDILDHVLKMYSAMISVLKNRLTD